MYFSEKEHSALEAKEWKENLKINILSKQSIQDIPWKGAGTLLQYEKKESSLSIKNKKHPWKELFSADKEKEQGAKKAFQYERKQNQLKRNILSLLTGTDWKWDDSILRTIWDYKCKIIPKRQAHQACNFFWNCWKEILVDAQTTFKNNLFRPKTLHIDIDIELVWFSFKALLKKSMVNYYLKVPKWVVGEPDNTVLTYLPSAKTKWIG